MRTANEAIEVCRRPNSKSCHLLAIIVCVRHHYPDLLADKMLADQAKRRTYASFKPWAATQPLRTPKSGLLSSYAACVLATASKRYRPTDRRSTCSRRSTRPLTSWPRCSWKFGAPFAPGALLPETPLGIQVRHAGALVRWGGHVPPRELRRCFESMGAALKGWKDYQEQAMKLQSAIRAEAMALKHPFTP